MDLIGINHGTRNPLIRNGYDISKSLASLLTSMGRESRQASAGVAHTGGYGPSTFMPPPSGITNNVRGSRIGSGAQRGVGHPLEGIGARGSVIHKPRPPLGTGATGGPSPVIDSYRAGTARASAHLRPPLGTGATGGPSPVIDSYRAGTARASAPPPAAPKQAPAPPPKEAPAAAPHSPPPPPRMNNNADAPWNPAPPPPPPSYPGAVSQGMSGGQKAAAAAGGATAAAGAAYLGRKLIKRKAAKTAASMLGAAEPAAIPAPASAKYGIADIKSKLGETGSRLGDWTGGLSQNQKLGLGAAGGAGVLGAGAMMRPGRN